MRFARDKVVLSPLIMLVALSFALGACTAGQSAATSTPIPDAQTLLNKAAAEVQNSKTIKIKLQLTGAPSFVDPPATPGGPGNNISFISANGLYVAPDKFSATVSAALFGVPGSVDVIAIGDDQWMKNQILTAGHWVSRVFSPGFNAAKLISSSEGIQAALKAFKNIKLVGVENIDGTDMIHITGTADGPEIASLTVGLIRGTIVNVDVYIRVDTGRADRVIMVQPDTVTSKDPKPTTWTLELFDYNADAQIAAPDAGGTPAATGSASAATYQTTMQGVIQQTFQQPNNATAPATAQATQAQ